jgi:transposase
MAGYDPSTDRLYGHVVKTKDRTAFLRFVRYLRSLHPPEVRIAIVLDNFSPHLATKNDQRVAEWADANNVELAYTPTPWLNRVEAQFEALRYFALDGTDHDSHEEQASMIRRNIRWRNRHAHDRALRELVNRANVPDAALATVVRGKQERPPWGPLRILGLAFVYQRPPVNLGGAQ